MDKQKIYTPLLLGIAVALGIFLGNLLNFKSNTTFKSKHSQKLNKLLNYIEYEYVDTVNTDSIVTVTVNNILEKLDPHSVYIDADEAQKSKENMQGDFVGIGISYYKIKDTLRVIKAIKGGPSYSAGIKGGDRILTIDGINIYDSKDKQQNVDQLLEGKIGDKTTLTVKRPGTKNTLSFTIKRARVPIPSVKAAYKLSQNLGYIKIDRFAESTYDEFMTALHKLKKEGITQLVLDLRDNIGGFIYPAERIADEFLEEDKLIVYTENKTGLRNYTYAKSNGAFEHQQLFILINENTASAAEITAGALQDNDKGTIIGRRSFGKGLVQREMELGDGSSVRLTTARYYTPTGRSIQRPYNKGKKEYYNDYILRYKKGELQSADSIQVADSLKFTTPKGKIVYGGGGIIPDVFIPREEDYDLRQLYYTVRSGYIENFIFNQLEKDRVYYNSLTEQEFMDSFEVTSSFIKDFISFTSASGLNFNTQKNKAQLKNYLKACIAKQLFSNNLFEKLLNKNDAMVAKAKQISTL